jgi:hypothetical protein
MPSPSFLPVVPNRWTYAESSADELFTGDTVQHPSASVAVLVEVGRTYLVDVGAIFSCSSAAASVALGWSGPAGATMQWNNTTGSLGYRSTIGLTDSYTGSTATRETFLRGRLTVGASAGSLSLTISTSDPAQTATLAAGSWLLLTRVK